MRLEVKLFASLRDKYPKDTKGVLTVEMPAGSTVAHLVKHLEIPENLPLVVMINGRREPESAPLKDGDRVGIFPPVGGG